MQIDIITIFPNILLPFLNESILKRAQQKNIVKINIHNLRDFTHDKHRSVDDYPYGGGAGMVLKPEPIFEAVESILKRQEARSKKQEAGSKKQEVKGEELSSSCILHPASCVIILTSPQGKLFNQDIAKELAKKEHLIIICGHYEGVDERVKEYLIDEEISIGDYILTGGELPAAVITDAVVRLLPGVVGNEESVITDSFSDGLLKYPQYTRPRVFRGYEVPEVLLSGNHKKIEQWRKEKALEKTVRLKPYLLKKN